jgi:HEAT repeat protein
MFPHPSQYATLPVRELLLAAAYGRAGVDQRWLRALADRGPSVVAELLAFAAQPPEDAPLSVTPVIVDLLRHFNAPESLDFFVSCVREDPEDVPDEVIEALLAQGSGAVEPLLRLYEELGEEQGSDVAFLLATLRLPDPRILKLLIERLEYDAADAAFCLGLYGDEAARPELQRMLAEIPAEDGDLRREFEVALQQLGTVTPREPEPFDLFAEYPPEAGPATDAMSEADRLEMTRSEDPGYRARATASFFPSELSAPVKKRMLELARTDPAPQVRARAWEALADQVDDPLVRKPMLAVLANEKAPLEERCGALIGLSPLDNEPEVAQRIPEFYAIPESRAKALEAAWRTLDRGFSDLVRRHLADPDPVVRRQAILGTGYLGIGAEADTLQKMFADDDFREDALFAYAMCVPGDVSRGRMKGLLAKIERLAGGLDEMEGMAVAMALDQRLALHGLEPVFFTGEEEGEDEDEVPAAAPPDAAAGKVGRNDPCPCGSGKKYKKCHGA